MAVIVTVGASLNIVDRWNQFDWIARFLAVVLLVSLAITPVTMIRREKKGTQEDSYRAMYAGYVWVMIAIMIFTRMTR